MAVWSIPTKATTVSTFLSDLRSDIGEQDSTNSRFTNAQLRRLLTRGTNIVATIIGGVEAQSKIALVDGKTDYQLPSGMWGLEAVMFKKGTNYLKLDYDLPRNLGTIKFRSVDVAPTEKTEGDQEAITQIEKYAIFKDTLLIYPTLDAYAYDTLYVKYFAAPASLDSNSQTTELDFWTDEFVLEAAAFYANKRDLTLSDEIAFWQSFYQRILTAQSQYARPQPALKAPEVQQ